MGGYIWLYSEWCRRYQAIGFVSECNLACNYSTLYIQTLAMWFCNSAYQEAASISLLLESKLALSNRMQWNTQCVSSEPRPEKPFPLLLLECCSFHENKPDFTCWRISYMEKEGLPVNGQPAPGKWPASHMTYDWGLSRLVKPTVQHRHMRECGQDQPRVLRLEGCSSYRVFSYTKEPERHRTDGCNSLLSLV